MEMTVKVTICLCTIDSSLTADHCFDDGFVRKQPVARTMIMQSTAKKTPGKHEYVHWPP